MGELTDSRQQTIVTVIAVNLALWYAQTPYNCPSPQFALYTHTYTHMHTSLVYCFFSSDAASLSGAD